jgi:hypothetical protein
MTTGNGIEMIGLLMISILNDVDFYYLLEPLADAPLYVFLLWWFYLFF